MNKLKSMLLGFVKPLVLAHVTDLVILAPKLSEMLVVKTNLTKEQSDALAMDVITILQHEVTLLINKL